MKVLMGLGFVVLGSAVSGAIAALCLVGYLFLPQEFQLAYLWSYLLVLSPAVGALALLAIHHLVGGGWGVALRRPLEAMTATLPWLALGFLPLCFHLPTLFPWAGSGAATDPTLAHQHAYLNPPFFYARAAVYFAAWNALGWRLRRLSDRQDEGEDVDGALAGTSALTLVVLLVTTFFAAVDWLVALEAHWFSTGIGLVFGAGMLATSLGVAIFTVARRAGKPPLDELVRPQHFNDMANVLLAVLMVCAYLSYTQMLIIWSGNLPADVVWYVRRATGHWSWMAVVALLLQFVVPFGCLLSRRLKRDPRTLGLVALLPVAGQVAHLFWQVVPSGRPMLSLSALDVALPVVLAGGWGLLYLKALSQRPLLPREASMLEAAPDHAYHAT